MTDQNTTDVQESQQTTGTSDAQNSDAQAADKQNTAAADTGNAASGTVTGGAETGNAGNEAADAGTGGDDKGELQRFREQLAGGDAGLLKQLERHKSIESISKSFKEARQAAKNVGKPLTLSEKATEDEIKAYREAMGIPEKWEDMPLKFREDFKASESDGAILDSVKEYVHAKNGDPRTAGIMVEWYQDFALAQQQQLNSNLAKVAKETQSTLRTEWGGEYDGNIGAAAELMTAQLGKDGFEDMMNLRLMDGSRLQDNLPFVKMMAQLGADYYGGNVIHTGDVETTSKTVEERINELLQLRATDSEKYFSDETQSKLTKLYAQRNKLQNRK